MRSSPKISVNPQTFDANLAPAAPRRLEALQTSVSGNIHIDLAAAENLKWFEFLIMILEAIKVGKIGIWISFVKGFPAKCKLHLAIAFGWEILNKLDPNPDLPNFDGI